MATRWTTYGAMVGVLQLECPLGASLLHKLPEFEEGTGHCTAQRLVYHRLRQPTLRGREREREREIQISTSLLR